MLTFYHSLFFSEEERANFTPDAIVLNHTMKTDKMAEVFDISLDLYTRNEMENESYHNITKSENDFHCKECGKDFKTEKKLVIHKKRHGKHPKNSGKKICDLCNKSFSKKLCLSFNPKSHFQRLHEFPGYAAP